MLHPANAATPATAAFGFAVHVNVAPAGVVMANNTLLVFPTIVLPPASCTATIGWVPNAAAPVAPTGWVVKPTLTAVPTVIVRLLLTAAVITPSVAVRV